MINCKVWRNACADRAFADVTRRAACRNELRMKRIPKRLPLHGQIARKRTSLDLIDHSRGACAPQDFKPIDSRRAIHKNILRENYRRIANACER